ncbi:hypothetical protein [Mycolicibacterium flavescens]|nr:hypothetical protein [Mycolicibacterium flavescens]
MTWREDRPVAARRFRTAPSALCALEPFWPSRRVIAFDEWCRARI